MSNYKQLDIYWVDLDPTKGAETRKRRPCVILQADLVNTMSRTLLVAPILPGHKKWPFVVNIKATSTNGLDKDRHINLKQVRVVDVSRVSKQQGKIEDKYFPKIQSKIKLVFGINS